MTPGYIVRRYSLRHNVIRFNSTRSNISTSCQAAVEKVFTSFESNHLSLLLNEKHLVANNKIQQALQGQDVSTYNVVVQNAAYGEPKFDGEDSYVMYY
jgi:hypothetical protein